jgi:hypothetical protein
MTGMKPGTLSNELSKPKISSNRYAKVFLSILSDEVGESCQKIHIE